MNKLRIFDILIITTLIIGIFVSFGSKIYYIGVLFVFIFFYYLSQLLNIAKITYPSVIVLLIICIIIIFIYGIDNLSYEYFEDKAPTGFCFNHNENKFTLKYGISDKCGRSKSKAQEEKEKCAKRIRELENEEAIQTDNSTLRIGFCTIKQPNGKIEIGYSLPQYPNQCISTEDYKKIMKKREREGFSMGLRFDPKTNNYIDSKTCATVIPSNMSKCLPYTTDFNEYCKKTFGNKYGIKQKLTEGCEPGYFKVQCAPNYENGFFIEDNQTKCSPPDTDFNKLCNDIFKNKKNARSMNYGWKYLDTKSCLNKEKRATCSSNYISGKPIYGLSTDCQYENYGQFDKLCKKLYGQKSKVKETGAFGCLPGFIRGICEK